MPLSGVQTEFVGACMSCEIWKIRTTGQPYWPQGTTPTPRAGEGAAGREQPAWSRGEGPVSLKFSLHAASLSRLHGQMGHGQYPKGHGWDGFATRRWASFVSLMYEWNHVHDYKIRSTACTLEIKLMRTVGALRSTEHGGLNAVSMCLHELTTYFVKCTRYRMPCLLSEFDMT